jgi:hypothetical protein
MTNDPAAEAVIPPGQQLILDALKKCGPLSRPELSTLLGLSIGAVRARLHSLTKAGLIVFGDDTIGLPGQPIDAWMTDQEREYQQRQWLWKSRGIVMVPLAELDDQHLAQRLHVLAVQLYGRRPRAP